QLVSGDFVSDGLMQRHSDLVYRLQDPDGQSDVYIVIEFQSTPDPTMPLRTSVYSGLLLQRVMRQQGFDPMAPWPPVLNIVLYTGHRPWRGGSSLARRFWRSPSGLLSRPPQHQFVLIDINRHLTDNIETLENLVSIMLQFERVRSTADFERLISRLIELLDPQDPLARAWMVWIENLIRNNSELDVDFSAVQTLTEMNMNLAQRFKQWQREYKAAGLQEGRQEGRQEGQVSTVLLLLKQRFGPLPPGVVERIHKASTEDIQQWLLRLLDAPTLDDVFTSPH
ncbi:MAG: hypothetical protein RIT26_2508, partial [Pseudomonadota bacterium]